MVEISPSPTFREKLQWLKNGGIRRNSADYEVSQKFKMIGFLTKIVINSSQDPPCQTDILKRTNATTIGIIYLFFAICNIINFFVLLISNKCLALLISDKCLLQNRHNITIDASEHVLIAHDHMLNLFRDFKKALSKEKFGKLLSSSALICIIFPFDDCLLFTLPRFVSVCKII